MDGSTALRLLKIEIDKQEGLTSAQFLDSELYYFLSSAYKATIDQKLQQYEIDQLVTDDLRELINESEIPVINKTQGSNKFTFSYDNDSTKLLRVEVKYQDDTQYMQCNRVSIDNINPLTQSKYNKPYIPRPFYYEIGSNVYVLADSDVNSLQPKVVYVAFNTPQTEEMQLPDKFVDDIIQLAADYALENIESQRSSTHYQLTTATNP